MLMGELVKK